MQTLKENFFFSRAFWWAMTSNIFMVFLILGAEAKVTPLLPTSIYWATIAHGFIASLYFVARDQAKMIMESIATLIRNWKSDSPAGK